jgi:hypothetical protein
MQRCHAQAHRHVPPVVHTSLVLDPNPHPDFLSFPDHEQYSKLLYFFHFFMISFPSAKVCLHFFQTLALEKSIEVIFFEVKSHTVFISFN